MKKFKRFIKIWLLIFMIVLAFAGIGLPIQLSSRNDKNNYHNEQVKEEKKKKKKKMKQLG